MSLLSSFPGGMAALGWLRLLLTALAFVLAPVVIGAVAYGYASILGQDGLGPAHLRILGLATLAFMSPLVGLPIWIMMALGAALLLKRNRFGTLQAALLGAVVFAVLARTDIGWIGVPFGVASGMLYRIALALQRPEAF